jgi:hypothetical protein
LSSNYCFAVVVVYKAKEKPEANPTFEKRSKQIFGKDFSHFFSWPLMDLIVLFIVTLTKWLFNA